MNKEIIKGMLEVSVSVNNVVAYIKRTYQEKADEALCSNKKLYPDLNRLAELTLLSLGEMCPKLMTLDMLYTVCNDLNVSIIDDNIITMVVKTEEKNMPDDMGNFVYSRFYEQMASMYSKETACAYLKKALECDLYPPEYIRDVMINRSGIMGLGNPYPQFRAMLANSYFMAIDGVYEEKDTDPEWFTVAYHEYMTSRDWDKVTVSKDAPFKSMSIMDRIWWLFAKPAFKKS